MQKHKITITVGAGGTVNYVQTTEGGPGNPGKSAHGKKKDTIEWNCPDGHLAGLFQGAGPMGKASLSADQGVDTEPLKITEPNDPLGNNTYKYTVMILTAPPNNVLIVQDPEIIVDPDV